MPTAQDAVVQQRTFIGPPFKFRKEPVIGFVLIHEQKLCQSQRDLGYPSKALESFSFSKGRQYRQAVGFLRAVTSPERHGYFQCRVIS
jgi:hypothetical protein